MLLKIPQFFSYLIMILFIFKGKSKINIAKIILSYRYLVDDIFF